MLNNKNLPLQHCVSHTCFDVCCSSDFLFTRQHFETKGHSNSFTSCVTLPSAASFLLLTGGDFWLTYCSTLPPEVFLKSSGIFYKML